MYFSEIPKRCICVLLNLNILYMKICKYGKRGTMYKTWATGFGFLIIFIKQIFCPQKFKLLLEFVIRTQLFGLVYGVLTTFQQYFSYIVTVSSIGGGNREICWSLDWYFPQIPRTTAIYLFISLSDFNICRLKFVNIQHKIFHLHKGRHVFL